MAIPTYVDKGTVANGVGDITVPWPVGTHQADDIGLLVIESCGGEAANLGTPAGFAAVTNSPQSTGLTTNGTRLSVYWCLATSGAMTSPVVTDPGNHALGRIHVFRGCHIASGNPWNITSGGVKASASGNTSIDGLTTTVADCLIVAICTNETDIGTAEFSNPQTNASLANITERQNQNVTSGNGGGILVITGEKAAAGTVSATTGTTVASSTNAFMCIALMPPQVGAAVKRNNLMLFGLGR